ncbi:MAG: HAMP domain-containing histidine kinase, partial [Anaerolineales bacterium]|nr:HAMP domain-containing histidine kinase [Anaerolineales bacterium]
VEAIHKAAQQGLPGPPSRESIGRIIRETLRVVQPNIVAPHVKIELKIKYELVVRVHLFNMVGALVNLIENALDAMEGSGTLTIRNEVIEKNEKKWILLNIHNTGPSLSEDEIRLLSEPGLSTKSQHQGYGIPLARQTIEEAGGSLTISSPSFDGGVDVMIQLPLPDSQDGIKPDSEKGDK